MESLKWIVVVFAALAMSLLLSDLIIGIKKRKNVKASIVGLVFLGLSIACYVPTVVFGDQSPQLLTWCWIFFLVGYFVCDVIMAVDIGKNNARSKRESTSDVDAEKCEKH